VKIPASLKNPDVLGWIIYLVLTVVLAYPCVMLMFKITYDTASTWTRVVGGIFVAAILAGFISWLGNEIWFRIKRRSRNKKRKIARKTKK
jgi:nicotinamide riboside transporter PnuC